MTIQISIDGEVVTTSAGKAVVDVAAAHGTYVPTLCYHPGHACLGTCRVCTVRVNGAMVASCTLEARDGMVVEVDTPELRDTRQALVEMLFVDGIHNCPSCEKSGRCTLQALGIEMSLEKPRFPYRYPAREAQHGAAELWLERDRCIFCQRCVEFVRDAETGRKVFSIYGRGEKARIEMDEDLADAMTPEQVDEAVALCPVGAILHKGVGYDTPIGRRRYETVSLKDRVLGRRPS
ncbi:MAG TPA: 2Fe-2S iron-sulfur cluster-binding protein [Dermatophilaceae bacterium]|nr:2Fe-2S iron-sulfur cluster-binding protein [Dermatophilaceae bacterium]